MGYLIVDIAATKSSSSSVIDPSAKMPMRFHDESLQSQQPVVSSGSRRWWGLFEPDGSHTGSFGQPVLKLLISQLSTLQLHRQRGPQCTRPSCFNCAHIRPPGPEDLRCGIHAVHSGSGLDMGRNQENPRVDCRCSMLRQPLQPHIFGTHRAILGTRDHGRAARVKLLPKSF